MTDHVTEYVHLETYAKITEEQEKSNEKSSLREEVISRNQAWMFVLSSSDNFVFIEWFVSTSLFVMSDSSDQSNNEPHDEQEPWHCEWYKY